LIGSALFPRRAAEGGQRFNRIVSGVGANVYGQGVTLLIQFGSVPLLLYAWGAETFGLWLVLSAVPSYLALADFGFSTAAANDMTLATARGSYDCARRVFQSVLALNALVALCLLVIAPAIVFLVPDRFLPQTAVAGSADVRLVLVLQTCQVAATLSCGAFSGGFQSSGRYALGIILSNSARLAESLALVAGALLFRSLAPAAALMLATRLAALFAMAGLLLASAPWLRIGFRNASLAEIRRLLHPALAVMALPAAFAISLQGYVLVIGACVSLNAVATFSTVRTMTRAVIQAGGVVNHAIMPELTRAFGEGDAPLIRRLIRLNLVTVLGLNALVFTLITSFGTGIIGVWTSGHIDASRPLTIGLAAVASTQSLWLSQANLILSVNQHAAYSYWFLIICIVSVLVAIPFAPAVGVEGLSLPLLAAECGMIFVVARAFRATFGPYLKGRSSLRRIGADAPESYR
jgi:O-antigen/teichoic acid export membrane protein